MQRQNTFINKYSDIVLAVIVVAIVGMMIVPLPTHLLDVLLTLNISISVLVLLISLYVPQALRLSIHPQPDPSTKIGVNLLGVSDPWLTPWHAAAVVDKTGTRLMHRADAEALGAKLVLDGGRPSHLELP